MRRNSTYGAFGDLRGQSGSTENSYLFAGEQLDENLGKYYLRQRYYDTETGRFTRRDLWEGHLDTPQSQHKYLYTHANPVNFTDPTGLFTTTEISAAYEIRNILAGLQLEMGSALQSAISGDWRAFYIGLGVGLGTALVFGTIARVAVQRSLPQGISSQQFREAGELLRSGIAHLGDDISDIAVHGSRANRTAQATSDIDFAIRVSPQKFDEILQTRFGSPNSGSAKERTMLHAIETGKIQAGEAGLRGLRRDMERKLGIEVDLSVIRIGGPTDNGPYIRLPKVKG